MRHRTLGFALGSCAVGLFAAHSAAQPAPAPAASAAPSSTAAATAAPTGSAAAPAATPAPVKPLSEALTGVAKAEYEGAKILYIDKDFASAIAKFQRAYELSSDARLLFNIAVCQKNLRKYSKMLATVRVFQTGRRESYCTPASTSRPTICWRLGKSPVPLRMTR